MSVLIIDDEDLRALLAHCLIQQWPDLRIDPFNPPGAAWRAMRRESR